MQTLQSLQGLGPDAAKLRDQWLNDPIVKLYASAAGREKVERTEIFLLPFKQAMAKADPQEAEKFYQGIREKLQKADHPTVEALILIELLKGGELNTKEEALARQQTGMILQQKVEARIKAEQLPAMEATGALLELALTQAISHPKKTAFELLRGIGEKDIDRFLGLEEGTGPKIHQVPVEKLQERKRLMLQARETILANKLYEKISQAGASEKPEERQAAYVALFKDPEIEKAKGDYKESLTWVGMMLQQGQLPEVPMHMSQEAAVAHGELEGRVRDFLALTEGKGSWGLRFEVGGRHIIKEVSKPSMLIPMVAAGFAGPLAEGMGLRLFARFGLRGRLLKTGAFVFKAAGDGMTFTTLHKGMEAAFHDAESQKWGWDYVKEVGGNTVMLGAMQAGHALIGGISRNILAKGRRGFGWAGGYMISNPAEAFLFNTASRITPAATMAAGSL
ncbi:MAG: hypothetical protein ACREP8_17020, partial [Candidatus Binatia bacterium]